MIGINLIGKDRDFSRSKCYSLTFDNMEEIGKTIIKLFEKMKKYRKNLKYYQNQNSFSQRITKKIKE